MQMREAGAGMGSKILGLNLFDGFRSRRISENLLWFALVFLPFQQALTLQVGFPLKATEVLIIAGVVASFLESRRGYLATGVSRLVLILAALVVVSTIWALVSTPANATDDSYSRGLVTDLLLYTGYAGLALVTCLTLMKTLTRDQMTSAIGLSVRLAAIYAVIQVVCWVADSSLLSVVNGDLQIGSLYGLHFPRNGSFREGNYLGFYAIAAVFVCLYGRDWTGVALAGFLVLYSASTTSFLAALAAISLIVLFRPTTKKLIAAGVVAVVGVSIALIVPAANRFVVAQLTKLGVIENTLGASYTFSLRDRTVSAETGFSMAGANPWLGVGQGRFAHHYWEYVDLTGLPEHYGYRFKRPIANNAYAQIAAETGLVALAILIIILIILFIRARGESDAILGLVCVLAVGLVAFPAWTNLVPWVLIAIAVVATSVSKSNAESHAQDHPTAPTQSDSSGGP